MVIEAGSGVNTVGTNLGSTLLDEEPQINIPAGAVGKAIAYDKIGDLLVTTSLGKGSLPVKYPVLLEKGETYYIAECPALPGCMTQGRTREEAITRIVEAIKGCIAVRKEMNLPTPELVEVEV